MNLLNTYKTNICRKAFEHWSVNNSIREFLQNCLVDGEDSYYEFLDDKLILGNKNIKLHPQVLLMGKSDKRNATEKVGRYGSGMNIAFSVLLDNNVDIEIMNADVIWKPCFEYCDTYQDDIVVIKEYENPRPSCNYEVVISNLQEADVHNIVETCLLFQEREILAETTLGNIIANPEDGQGGEIFVKGLFVTQNECLKYSYDFLPEHLPLNQDRNLADTWELKQRTALMWKQVEDIDLLSEAIKSNSEDCQLVSSSWNVGYGNTSHAASEALAEEFFEEKGDCLITDDYDDYKRLRDDGNKVELVDNKALYESVIASDTYQEKMEDITIIEREDPNEIIEKVLTLLWQEDIIPVDSIDEQNEGVGTDIKLLLYQLRDGGIEWRR